MFYQLKYDMDLVDKVIEKKKCYIYGDGNNINDIEYENYPKGRFHTIIYSEKKVESWPNVEFYYNSLEMTEESDYLGNIDSWPIFRKNVVKILKKEYPNLEFYPVKLIDGDTLIAYLEDSEKFKFTFTKVWAFRSVYESLELIDSYWEQGLAENRPLYLTNYIYEVENAEFGDLVASANIANKKLHHYKLMSTHFLVDVVSENDVKVEKV